MSFNDLNLALRFLLELAALAALGAWGWNNGSGVLRWVLALGVPLIAAVLWGVFRVPGDPGDAPFAIPGLLRLALELAFFGAATWALFDIGRTNLGWVFGIIVFLHYIASLERIRWLIQQ